MAAIESETVKSRCGDGHGFDFDLLKLPRRPDENAIEKFKGKPKFGGGGGSYKPKPKWFYSDWWLLEEISDGDSESDDEGVNHLDDLMACCDTPCEPDLKPPVKIGNFHVPHYLEAFVEMTSATGSYHENTNSVLVTNLPYYVKTNSDLAELCNPFGNVTSADVAIDHEFGCTGRFGFVSFSTRGGAQNAINHLDGSFCINAAIGVQWVTPKT